MGKGRRLKAERSNESPKDSDERSTPQFRTVRGEMLGLDYTAEGAELFFAANRAKRDGAEPVLTELPAVAEGVHRPRVGDIWTNPVDPDAMRRGVVVLRTFPGEVDFTPLGSYRDGPYRQPYDFFMDRFSFVMDKTAYREFKGVDLSKSTLPRRGQLWREVTNEGLPTYYYIEHLLGDMVLGVRLDETSAGFENPDDHAYFHCLVWDFLGAYGRAAVEQVPKGHPLRDAVDTYVKTVSEVD